MQFLKILFWCLLAFVAAVFTVGNWTTVPIKLWGGLIAEVNLPLLLFVTFLLGLVPTMIGLYGVMASAVASRTVEVAVRMALGASAARVRREILAQVFGLLAAGVAIGGAASLGLAPAFRTFLVGVSGFDPVTFGAAVTALAVVGLAAGIVPAIRASRVHPMRALRRQ